MLSYAQEAGVARVMVGVEQSAAPSTTPVQKLTVRLFFTEPLGGRLSGWGDVRLSSLPTTISSSIATLPADTLKLAAAEPVSQLVRSGEFLAGAGYRVSGGAGGWSTVQMIASVGAAMPLSPAAAMLPDQNRFWRQYYGGVRVLSTQRTHMVDVSVGQNEAITGGGFHGTVLRVDGFYALPVSTGNFLYLSGTAIFRASPRSQPGDLGTDSYRVGIAVDFFQMLKALRLN